MKKSANSSAFPPAKPTFFKAKSINALFFVIGLFFGVMLYDLRFVLFTRIESNAHLAPSHFKRNTCFKGVVLHVTDGDSLKIFHTPLTWRFCALQTLEGIAKNRFKHQTITVRLAGIDAPEVSSCF